MITGHTKVVALLANPSKHSMSPTIHNHAYLKDNLDFVYVAFEVEDIKDAMIGIKSLKLHGLNVSMPFKESIIPYLDGLDDSAKLSKAVNTVVHIEGKYIGYNTDGIGLLNALKQEGVHIENNNITILGSGGAAISIAAYMALQNHKEITILKRNIENIDFIDKMNHIENETGCKIIIKDINDKKVLKQVMHDSDIVIQATSVGMGNLDCLIEDNSYFKKDTIVVDIVYNPLETTFLKYAKSVNCKCFNGLSMLLHQGAVAHELFTGKKMPLDDCKKVMEDVLCKK